jgi:hypothetical protein
MYFGIFASHYQTARRQIRPLFVGGKLPLKSACLMALPVNQQPSWANLVLRKLTANTGSVSFPTFLSGRRGGGGGER